MAEVYSKADIDSLMSELGTRMAALSGGGGSSSVFQSRSHTTTINYSTDPLTRTPILWDTPEILSSGFSMSSGEVTIGSELDGLQAMLNACVTIKWSNRSLLFVTIERNEGSGFSTYLETANYNTRDGSQNFGTTNSGGVVIPLVDGDIWRVSHSVRIDGSGTPEFTAEGSFFNIITI